VPNSKPISPVYIWGPGPLYCSALIYSLYFLNERSIYETMRIWDTRVSQKVADT